ncbi:PEP/pyruvate-binding domain-containing protein [Sphaerisporangium sp. NPDC051011]|uniref:PEP/pyruvate-binding domain-containing protein n=1 Tax=Sphaerisporangium sp. NPDC051011 TaxID=3155792 RepID=UPI0033C081B1
MTAATIPIVLGTKAQTLARVRGALTTATVLDQVTVTVAQWRNDQQSVIDAVREAFPDEELIVRSSAPDEDTDTHSAAGLYASVLHVPASEIAAVTDAVEAVISSYTRRHGQDVDDFEVLIQPMLADVTASGVAFSRDLNGAPYLVVNYSEGKLTDTVTSGVGAVPEGVRIHHDVFAAELRPPLGAVAAIVRELVQLTGTELDVEFAVSSGHLYVLQARPLQVGVRDRTDEDARVAAEIAQIKDAIHGQKRPRGGLCGSYGGVYSTMADWNPAEMIGSHPRPLALSLYQRLITREVWREARARLGYRNPAPHQLMVTLAGHPYIDVRADLNSYLPADLDDGLCNSLVDFYLARLGRAPQAHDKIEFLVCPSVLDLDFSTHATAMAEAGFTAQEIDQLRGSLLRLSNSVIRDLRGVRSHMHYRIDQLPARRAELLDRIGEEHPLFLADALLEDCLHFGTLPFAVAVRGTFMGVALWRSLLTTGVIDQEQHDGFLAGIETVSTRFAADLAACQHGDLPQEDFLARYGHLRPGTYDITIPSYAAAPHLYLSGVGSQHRRQAPATGVLPARVMGDIDDHLEHAGFEFDASTLLDFIREAQVRREGYKFEFTANLSHALDLISAFGQQHDLDAACLSWLTVEDLLACATSTVTSRDTDRLRHVAEDRRRIYQAQSLVHLPDVISGLWDVDVVTGRSAPNFITNKTITGPAVLLAQTQLADVDLTGRIVLTTNADPGYEFLFCRNIAGLITQYGGAASHMAIRCTEIGIPAAIGCGRDIFDHLAHAGTITLDCAQQRIIPG